MPWKLRLSAITILSGIMALVTEAGDWSGFRGPTGNFISTETGLPTTWNTEKNVQWKITLPGVAWSCPIVVGDKVFVTTAITKDQKKPKANDFGGGKGGFGPNSGGGKGGFGGFGGSKAPDVEYTWQVVCLDRTTGKTIWSEKAAEQKPTIPIHSTNTYASETPVTEGRFIYAYFGMLGVYCYDLEGKLQWKKEMPSYPMMAGWGTGSSPTLHEGKLFIQCDNEQKSFVMALDTKTGKELWKKDRSDKSGWATPLIWKNKVRTELICLSASRVRSYNPADGELLWEMQLSKSSPNTSSGMGMGGFGGGRGGASCNASPVADEETLFVGNGGAFGRTPLYAIKAGAKGDITPKTKDKPSEFILWTNERSAPSMSTPVLYQGYLYIAEQRGGTLTCLDAKTGKEMYRERIPRASGITSSPWAYQGKIFVLDDSGTTFVIEAGKDFKVLNNNPLKEMFWSSPAIAQGMLFLRGVDHLYCIKEKESK